MEIGLLTINTWKCDGDYFPRRQALARQLQSIPGPARVILCQECYRSADGQTDTLGYLSAALDLPAWFAPARRKIRRLDGTRMDSFSGLGILTNLPVSRQLIIDLPSSPSDGGRVAQLLTVGIHPGRSMLIANVHLTHLPDSQALRARQLETVLRIMQRSAETYRVIGGDFNAPSDSTEIRLLKEHGPAADCYQLGGGRGNRYSLLSALEEQIPYAVDHLFTLPQATTTTYPSFADATVVLDRPDETSGLYPSDHFGLQVRLSVPE